MKYHYGDTLFCFFLFNPRFTIFSHSPLPIWSKNTFEDPFSSQCIQGFPCAYRYLEATYVRRLFRVCFCPQRHMEVTQCPSPYWALSCPQGHLVATHFLKHPNTPLHGTKSCYCQDVWRLHSFKMQSLYNKEINFDF